MAGTDVAIEALGEVIQAYKARIAALEAIVVQQQAQLAKANGATPDPSTSEFKESADD